MTRLRVHLESVAVIVGKKVRRSKRKGQETVTLPRYKTHWRIVQHDNGKILADDIKNKKDAKATARLMGWQLVGLGDSVDGPIAHEMVEKEKFGDHTGES